MIETKKLSLKEAEVLIEAAERKSDEMKIPMCIAVADDAGNLVAFKRMDGAKITSIDIAVSKAFTAAAAKRATRDYNKMAASGSPAFGINFSNYGRFSSIAGGVPVTYQGQIVGSIGVSGGSASEDDEVAVAAVESFGSSRKKA